MAAKKDDIVAAVGELERVLMAGGPAQDARLDGALARLEEAARRHIGVLSQPDGLVGAVDRPLIPSPGVDRETAHLSEELEALLRDVRELRARTPVPGQPMAAADHAALLRRARQLADALERFENKEAHLILDSVITDIGAGD